MNDLYEAAKRRYPSLTTRFDAKGQLLATAILLGRRHFSQ